MDPSGSTEPLTSDWRRVVDPYTGPEARRASFQLVTTLGLLLGVMVVAREAMGFSPLLTSILVLPTAGLLVRTFIIMHDCAHGSFFASRRLNDVVGFFRAS